MSILSAVVKRDLPDTTLKKKLKDSQYIMAFMHLLIKWYKRYKEEGLTNNGKLPSGMEKDRKIYKGRIDPFIAFFDDVIEEGDDTDFISNSELKDRYIEYMEITPGQADRNLPELLKKAIARILKVSNFQRRRVDGGQKIGFCGFKLNKLDF